MLGIAATTFSTDFQYLTGLGVYSGAALTDATRDTLINADYAAYVSEAGVENAISLDAFKVGYFDP